MDELCIKRFVTVLFCENSVKMRRLIIRPGAIGDFVVSLPAMECLRDGYLEVWAASVNVPLARFADRARSIASTGLDLVGITDAAAAPARRTAIVRFDRVLVRREPPGVPRGRGGRWARLSRSFRPCPTGRVCTRSISISNR